MDGANINGREVQCKIAEPQDIQKLLEKGKRKAPRIDHGFDNYSNPNNIPTSGFSHSPNKSPFPPSPAGGGLLPLPNTPPLIPFHQTAAQQATHQVPHQGLLQNPNNPNLPSNNPGINLPTKPNPPLGQPNPPLLHQPNPNPSNSNPSINRPNSPPAGSGLLQPPPMGPGGPPPDPNNPLTSLGNFFKSLNLSPNLPLSKLPPSILNNIPASIMNGISPSFTIGNFLQQLQQIQMQQSQPFTPPPPPVPVNQFTRNVPAPPPQPQYPVGPPSIYTIPQSELKAALTSRQFYIIDFESSCGVWNTFPCEVAIMALTFSSQVAQHPDNFHRFIDSSPIPGCLISEALFAQSTHGIPRSGFKEATKDYQKVLQDIQAFTNVQEPMFFAKGPKQSIKSLEWLAEKTGRKAVLSWQIKPIEELVEIIHRAYDRQISAASAGNIFITDHNIPQDIKCDYHKSQDKKYRCVLGDVKKLSLLLKSTIADVKQHSYSFST
eukprot:Phypoly_transcript_06878.p1 GENE.Phypoly_transcript_06878~~Phypoly_transcript_06878.p1  ORF type:complete len:570 (+),score=82.40 Phypoly_transcript_06878:239-1711(+)